MKLKMKIALTMANYVLINYHFLSFFLNSRYKKWEMVEISQMAFIRLR